MLSSLSNEKAIRIQPGIAEMAKPMKQNILQVSFVCIPQKNELKKRRPISTASWLNRKQSKTANARQYMLIEFFLNALLEKMINDRRFPTNTYDQLDVSQNRIVQIHSVIIWLVFNKMIFFISILKHFKIINYLNSKFLLFFSSVTRY